MRKHTWQLPFLIVCLLVIAAGIPALAARTVEGTLVSWAQDTLLVQPDGASRAVALRPAKDVQVVRGQVGRESRKSVLWDLAPGDRVVAVVRADGLTSSLKAFYEVAKGTLVASKGNKLFLSDGSSVTMRPKLQVVFSEGKMGKPADLKPGTLVLCRLNPTTKEAWTVVATAPAVLPKPAAPVKKVAPVVAKPAAKPAASAARLPAATAKPPVAQKNVAAAKTPAVAKPAPAKLPVPAKMPAVVPTPPVAAESVPAEQPRVDSIKFVGPGQLRIRDWIRVEISGTPGCRATCQVKGLIPVTLMNETTPGNYRASVMIPGGKPVTDAALVGKLSLNGVESEPVQASRLITIEAPVAAPVEPETPATALAKPVISRPSAVAAHPAPSTPVEEPVAAATTQATDQVQDTVNPAPAPEVPEAPAAATAAAPEPPKAKAPVVIVEPADQALIARAIVVSGTAEPGAQVEVRISYDNNQGGILTLRGQVASQLVAVDGKGQFRMGPIALEGPLATKGLVFTITARCAGSGQAATVTAYGARE